MIISNSFNYYLGTCSNTSFVLTALTGDFLKCHTLEEVGDLSQQLVVYVSVHTDITLTPVTSGTVESFTRQKYSR